MKYPKIETLYDRDDKTHKLAIPLHVRCTEFSAVKDWIVTEKVDGTNIRILYNAEKQSVVFGGRTDNAQLPANLVTVLRDLFPVEKFIQFSKDVILFGEGYGEKIQSVGKMYRRGVWFRLFDAVIAGYWLEYGSMGDLAESLEIDTVPHLKSISRLPASREDLLDITGNMSNVSRIDGGDGVLSEGIVARSYPLMFDRLGNRIVWKLKFKDFAEESK